MDSGYEPLEEDPWSMLIHWAKTSSFNHALTRTGSGDVCLRLDNDWESLLSDLESLGPVALLSCHDNCQVTQLLPEVDFQAVPGTPEIVEINSGLILDTGEWSFALGVEERRQGGSMLGLQFFDRHHSGILKILLTSDSNLLPFRQLLRKHICPDLEPEWADPAGNILPPAESWPERNIAVIRRSWKQFNPFHPDASGWQNENRNEVVYKKLGMPYAQKIDPSDLINQVMSAHHQALLLDILFYRKGLSRKIKLIPHRLERCPCGLHLIDSHAQILLPLQGFRLWSTNYPNSNTQCLEAFNGAGERLFALRAA